LRLGDFRRFGDRFGDFLGLVGILMGGGFLNVEHNEALFLSGEQLPGILSIISIR
jgi:hypothetical protein